MENTIQESAVEIDIDDRLKRPVQRYGKTEAVGEALCDEMTKGGDVAEEVDDESLSMGKIKEELGQLVQELEENRTPIHEDHEADETAKKRIREVLWARQEAQFHAEMRRKGLDPSIPPWTEQAEINTIVDSKQRGSKPVTLNDATPQDNLGVRPFWVDMDNALPLALPPEIPVGSDAVPSSGNPPMNPLCAACGKPKREMNAPYDRFAIQMFGAADEMDKKPICFPCFNKIKTGTCPRCERKNAVLMPTGCTACYAPPRKANCVNERCGQFKKLNDAGLCEKCALKYKKEMKAMNKKK